MMNNRENTIAAVRGEKWIISLPDSGFIFRNPVFMEMRQFRPIWISSGNRKRIL